MEHEKEIEIELVIDRGTYADVVSIDTANFMLKADIVTVRNTSVRVKEIEVTELGVIRFHGDLANL